MHLKRSFAVIGGDLRQRCLLRQLRGLPVEQGVLVERGISQMLSALELANDKRA